MEIIHWFCTKGVELEILTDYWPIPPSFLTNCSILTSTLCVFILVPLYFVLLTTKFVQGWVSQLLSKFWIRKFLFKCRTRLRKWTKSHSPRESDLFSLYEWIIACQLGIRELACTVSNDVDSNLQNKNKRKPFRFIASSYMMIFSRKLQLLPEYLPEASNKQVL